MKKTLIIFISILAFISCTNQKYDKQIPADFSFKIINMTNSYDSKTGIYVRSYVKKDSVVKVVMTQKEMNIIYELFKKNDFLSFPDIFECYIFGTKTLPAFDTTIEINYKGVIKRVKNTTYCNKKTEQRKSDRFDEFSSEIRKIINNKTEIKNMRDCDMIFL
ncbi:MAG TPA: hypothetical protein VFK73_04875 [Paludibacter sp.]|nr:hypothetical protein [Paludibacter sp.]